MALQSAAFSAAVTNNTYRAFYVFEFLIDEEYWYIIKTDGSMKKFSACSVCIEANLLKSSPIIYTVLQNTILQGLQFLSQYVGTGLFARTQPFRI